MTSQEESAVIEKYADKSEVLKSYDPVKDVDGFTHNLTVEKNVFYGRIYGEKKFQAVHSQVKTDTGKDLGSEFLKSTNKYEIALKAADHDYRLTKKEAK